MYVYVFNNNITHYKFANICFVYKTKKLGSYSALASLHYDLLTGTVLSQDDIKYEQEPPHLYYTSGAGRRQSSKTEHTSCHGEACKNADGTYSAEH